MRYVSPLFGDLPKNLNYNALPLQHLAVAACLFFCTFTLAFGRTKNITKCQ